MATSKIPKFGAWEVTTLASGIKQYVNSDLHIACLSLDGYTVSGSSVGNAGTVEVSPRDTVYGGVYIASYGQGALKIETSGRLSLMSPSLGAYISGQVYGTFFFPIN